MKLKKSFFQSHSLEYSSILQRLKQKNVPLLSLGLGEPEFKTPKLITNAIKKSLDRGDVKYSSPYGLFLLRESIADYYNIYKNCSLTTKNVFIASGAKGALSILLCSILKPKDEVIIFKPAYVSYSYQVELAEPSATTKTINSLLNEGPNTVCFEKGFNNKTKAVILANPSNPDGKVINPTELWKLADTCKRNKIYLIVDEVYGEMILRNTKYNTAAKRILDNKFICVVNSFSKTYAMTGLRLGYLLADQEIVDRSAKIAQHQYTNINVSVQNGGIAALQLSQNFYKKYPALIEKNELSLFSYLSTLKTVSYIRPQGGMFGFLKINGRNKSAETIIRQLLQNYKVAVCPGSVFGIEFKNYIRISLTPNNKTFKKGLKLISKCFDENFVN